jgi:hypothetical protein
VLSINRDYLILTNRLNNLISLINWIVGKEEKRSNAAGNVHFFNFQFLCFKAVNVLLNQQLVGRPERERTTGRVAGLNQRGGER